jgi:hypothetical protein
MSDKTKEQLEEEIRVRNLLDAERCVSDGKYAPIIIKTIVFSFVGMALIALVGALFKLVVK